MTPLPDPGKVESLLLDPNCYWGGFLIPSTEHLPSPTTCLEGETSLAAGLRMPTRHVRGPPTTPTSRPVAPGQNGCSVRHKMCCFRLLLLLLLLLLLQQRQTMVPKKAAVPAPVLCPCTEGAGNNRPLNASSPGPCAQAGGPSVPRPTHKLQGQKEERGNL